MTGKYKKITIIFPETLRILKNIACLRTYLIIYLLTYSIHGAKSFFRS